MASLLQEIEHEATESRAPLGDLLRKCQILAERLGNGEFREWVDHELNGYPDDSELPPYRVGLRTLLRGSFRSLTWQATDYTLPTETLQQEIRDLIETRDLREGIAELEHLLATAENGVIRLYLPQPLWRFLPSMAGAQTLEIWGVLSTNQIAGVLDQVRNRALKLALQIERLDPNAGNSPGVASAASPDAVSQVFNTTVMGVTGGMVQIAPGSTGSTQTAVVVGPGDLAALRSRLRQLGLTDAELDELSQAIKADGKPSGKEPGPKVTEWIGRITFRLAAVAGSFGEATAAGVVASEIAKFLGIAH